MQVEGVNLVIGTKDRAQIVEMVENYDLSRGVENHVSDIMKERIFEPLKPCCKPFLSHRRLCL